MFYAVSIFLRSSQPVGSETLLQETIRLVEASSCDAAVDAAGDLAKSLESRYENADGNEVTWTVEEVDEPQEILDPLQNGTELLARTLTLTERRAMKTRYTETP